MSDHLLLTSEDLRIVVDALVYTGNNDPSKDQAQKMMIADMIRVLSQGIEDLTIEDYNSISCYADAIENGGGVALPVLQPPHSIYGNPDTITLSVNHHLAEAIAMATSRVVLVEAITNHNGSIALLGLAKDIMSCLSHYSDHHKEKVELLDRAIAQKMDQGLN